ncbi:DUF255 domain-containing protein, partial [Salmonella enterica]|uniref:DUF255 domain-containing protein n=1 Tax=Salmonella enterica TaxID=28901 RepID=UPI003299C802
MIKAFSVPSVDSVVRLRIPVLIALAIVIGTPAIAANRLEKENSPYLLQHAKNPVDWFAWGPEA